MSSIPMIVLTSFVTQALGYFVVAGALFFGVWRWGRERFSGARIPSPRRVDGTQLRREMANTLVTMLAGTTSAGTIIALRAAGLTQINDGPTSMAVLVLWILGALLFNDAWFYGWHRLLHHPTFFRYVHVVHHRSVDVNPFTSYSFHAVEAILLGIWIVPAAVFLPIPMTAIAALQVIGLGNNLMAHLGYEFLPKWILRVPMLRWCNTATFHSLHHSRSRGNFGLHSRLWDRLFGTEIPDYEKLFVERGAAVRSTERPSAE